MRELNQIVKMASSQARKLVESVQANPESFNDFRGKDISLPKDLEDLKAEMLRRELAIASWMRICLLYFGQKREKEFEEITWEMFGSIKEANEEERLQALTILSSFYINRIIKDGINNEAIEKLFECIKKADRIDARNPEMMIGKSCYYLFKQKDLRNHMRYAERAFEEQKVKERKSQYIEIKKIASDFQSGKTAKAKEELENAIESNKSRTLSPFLHLALASVILVTLKKEKINELSFPMNIVENVNEFIRQNVRENPIFEKRNTELFVQVAQVSALIELRRGNTRQYVQFITQAYQKDKENFVTQVHMAHILHCLNRHEAAKDIALAGLQSTKRHFRPSLDQLSQFETQMRFDVLEIESRFHYYLGFHHHQKGDLSNARKEYIEATALWDKNTMALYGLAQVQCLFGEKSAALEAVKAILRQREDMPESADCFVFFARVFHENGDAEEAKKYYKKAIKGDPRDYSTRFRYAYLLEESENGIKGEALEIYEDGIRILEENGTSFDEIPAETSNNIGLQFLKWKKNEYKGMLKATRIIESAEHRLEQEIKKKKGKVEREAKLLVIKSTLALVLEARGKFIQAEEKHREITRINPLFVESFIKISRIKVLQGDIPEAKKIIAKGIHKVSSFLKKLDWRLRENLELKRKIEKSLEFLNQQEGNLLLHEGMIEGARRKFDKERPSSGLLLSKARLEYNQSMKTGESKTMAHGLRERIKDFSTLARSKSHEESCYVGQMIMIEAALQSFGFADFGAILYLPLLNDPFFAFNLGVYNFTNQLYEDSIKKFKDVLQAHTFQEVQDSENVLYCLIGSILIRKNEEEDEGTIEALSLLKKLMFVAPEHLIHIVNFVRNLYWKISRNEQKKNARNWEENIKTTGKILRMMEKLIKTKENEDPLHREAEKLKDSFYETIRPAIVYMKGKLQKQKEKEALIAECNKGNCWENKNDGMSNEMNGPKENELSQKENHQAIKQKLQNQVKLLEWEIQRNREEKERLAKEFETNGAISTSEKKKKRREGGRKKEQKKEEKTKHLEEQMIQLSSQNDEDSMVYLNGEVSSQEVRVISENPLLINTDSEGEEGDMETTGVLGENALESPGLKGEVTKRNQKKRMKRKLKREIVEEQCGGTIIEEEEGEEKQKRESRGPPVGIKELEKESGREKRKKNRKEETGNRESGIQEIKE